MTTTTRTPILFSAVLLLALAGQGRLGAQSPSGLYQRVGGYDVIAAVVHDFMGRFAGDPALRPFLGGLNAAAGARVTQNFVDFFCSRSGGPCIYNGRDMGAAHEGLPITGAHFDAVMRHLGDALAAHDVPAAARDEFLALAAALRSEIVAPPPGG